MDRHEPTAWEMTPRQLIDLFARRCAEVGSASGVIDFMEGSNRAEAVI